MIYGGNGMDAQDQKHFKNVLLKRRREIFDRLQGFESDWEALSERDIEMEKEEQEPGSRIQTRSGMFISILTGH